MLRLDARYDQRRSPVAIGNVARHFPPMTGGWLTFARPAIKCSAQAHDWVGESSLGLIAQLAERVADNDEVPGSSPGGPSFPA